VLKAFETPRTAAGPGGALVGVMHDPRISMSTGHFAKAAEGGGRREPNHLPAKGERAPRLG
jgi:hypothetical protein